MKTLIVILGLLSSCLSYAFNRQDMWHNSNQQAMNFMSKQQFQTAASLFTDPAWQATAFYRAQQFKEAATAFHQLNTALGFYNEGNAWAQLHEYEKALAAYKQALMLNPKDKDAQFNRDLVQALLNQRQEKNDNKEKQDNKEKKADQKENNKKENKEKKDNDKKSAPSSEKESSAASKENKPVSKQQNTAKKDQDTLNEKKDNSGTNDEKGGSSDANPKNEEQKIEKNNPSSPSKKKGNQQVQVPQSSQQQEANHANEQWLRLVPDEPGGLLREKFLRDYLRKQQGWNQ